MTFYEDLQDDTDLQSVGDESEDDDQTYDRDGNEYDNDDGKE